MQYEVIVLHLKYLVFMIDMAHDSGNEISGSIESSDTAEWLHNWWPLEEYSLHRVKLVDWFLG
jgi:hypothetical protein